jgi:hypothetical protein
MPSTRCEAIWESQMVKEQATQHERLRRRCHVVCQPHMLGYGGGEVPCGRMCRRASRRYVCRRRIPRRRVSHRRLPHGVHVIHGRASHKCVFRRHISFRGTSHRGTSVGIHLINVHLIAMIQSSSYLCAAQSFLQCGCRFPGCAWKVLNETLTER